MFKHRLDNAVGAFAVLGDLLQVAGQHGRDILDLCALFVGQGGKTECSGFLQFGYRAVQRSIDDAHGKDCIDATEGDAVPTI